MPGAQMGMVNLGDMFGKAFGEQKSIKRMSVEESYEALMAEESDRLLDQDLVVRTALENAQNDGIVFIDEIDKICARSDRLGADVSREGVQRDLLPLIEGTTVTTKHGAVTTDHILFIGFRRLSLGEAGGPLAGAPGAAADSRRAEFACSR